METLDAEKVMSDDMLVLSDSLTEVSADGTTVTDYFAAVRLSRQQARDSAVSLLQEAMAYTDGEVSGASGQQLEDIVQTAL